MVTKLELLMAEPKAIRRFAKWLRVPEADTIDINEAIDSIQAVLDCQEYDMPHPFDKEENE